MGLLTSRARSKRLQNRLGQALRTPTPPLQSGSWGSWGHPRGIVNFPPVGASLISHQNHRNIR